LGQIIQQTKNYVPNTPISLSNLADGIYYYEVIQNNEVKKVGKLVLKK
jgi:hypothetical protein